MTFSPSFMPPSAPDGVLNLLQLLSRPEDTKAVLNDFVRLRDEANAAAAKLNDLQARSDALTKKAAELDLVAAQNAARLQDAADKIAADRALHAQEVELHQAEVAKLQDARAALAASKQLHADKLAELDKFKALLKA